MNLGIGFCTECREDKGSDCQSESKGRTSPDVI